MESKRGKIPRQVNQLHQRPDLIAKKVPKRKVSIRGHGRGAGVGGRLGVGVSLGVEVAVGVGVIVGVGVGADTAKAYTLLSPAT